jgi:WD40 repeat protein
MELTLETATLSCQSEVASVQFHPSEQALCVGCIDGAVQFYEWKESSQPSEGFLELVEGWEELADEEEGSENVRAVAFISGGDNLACGTSSGCITLYDARSGNSCDTVTAEGDVYSLLAVGSESKVLAAGAMQCTCGFANRCRWNRVVAFQCCSCFCCVST